MNNNDNENNKNDLDNDNNNNDNLLKTSDFKALWAYCMFKEIRSIKFFVMQALLFSATSLR